MALARQNTAATAAPIQMSTLGLVSPGSSVDRAPESTSSVFASSARHLKTTHLSPAVGAPAPTSLALLHPTRSPHAWGGVMPTRRAFPLSSVRVITSANSRAVATPNTPNSKSKLTGYCSSRGRRPRQRHQHQTTAACPPLDALVRASSEASPTTRCRRALRGAARIRRAGASSSAIPTRNV